MLIDVDSPNHVCDRRRQGGPDSLVFDELAAKFVSRWVTTTATLGPGRLGGQAQCQCRLRRGPRSRRSTEDQLFTTAPTVPIGGSVGREIHQGPPGSCKPHHRKLERPPGDRRHLAGRKGSDGSASGRRGGPCRRQYARRSAAAADAASIVGTRDWRSRSHRATHEPVREAGRCVPLLAVSCWRMVR